MKTASFSLALTLTFLAAGCASLPAAPTSEVTGKRYTKTEMNRSHVIILDVDGVSHLDRVVKIEPGRRVVRMQALPVGGFRMGQVVSMPLDVKPCTRYYINAQRKTALSQDWDPVIDFEEPIAGCTP